MRVRLTKKHTVFRLRCFDPGSIHLFHIFIFPCLVNFCYWVAHCYSVVDPIGLLFQTHPKCHVLCPQMLIPCKPQKLKPFQQNASGIRWAFIFERNLLGPDAGQVVGFMKFCSQARAPYSVTSTVHVMMCCHTKSDARTPCCR